jgi:hypothetical protein
MKYALPVAIAGLVILFSELFLGSATLASAGFIAFLAAGMAVAVVALWVAVVAVWDARILIRDILGVWSAEALGTPTRLAILLYVLACLLPCIDCGPDFQTSDPGWPDLEKGWHWGLPLLLFGHSGGNNGVPWSANVFFAAGLLCLRREWDRAALGLGLLATALGLTIWWIRRDDHLLVGYYLWQASLMVLVVAAALACVRSPRRAHSIAPALPQGIPHRSNPPPTC